MRLPGPTEVLPGKPAAIVDLRSADGAALVGGTWRYADASIREVAFTDVADHLGPGGAPNRTYDVEPRAQAPDFDDSAWRVLTPEETTLRLGHGRVSFNWYRIEVEIPQRVGELDPTGMTAVFEVVLDDYAEVWVDGELPLALGTTGGQVVGGFNAPNRVVLTRDARPGQRFSLAVFGINGPISASPENYIWMRSATLELHATRSHNGHVEQVATGFEFTEGPVWSPEGALLFSSPNTNAIYRWSPEGSVHVFRPKSGYAGLDIGRYTQPGSNGLAFDPEGRLTICQHGNRRVLRVEPHGNTTVLADRYDGRRLNSPNDLVYRSDGTLFFTDPPFGLPGMDDDPDRELDFSGVFMLAPGGELTVVDDTLGGPNGIALSPDERFLYVGNWDLEAKVVVRYELATGARDVLFDMTGAPGEDAIDGIEVDPRDGQLYVCGPGGIWVISADGEHLETIEVPEAPHNLAWGDDDGRTLYVTALSSIYRIRRER
jgi:gluconolactonase